MFLKEDLISIKMQPRPKRLKDGASVNSGDGKERFHGAFTGGFSAGYYNSVGSAEGFTPQTFSSSRGNRAIHPKVARRPEDYMDEEDGLLGATLMTDSAFATAHAGAAGAGERSGRGKVPRELDLVPAELLTMATATEGVGKMLLRKMGWQEGQAVGPRARSTRAGTLIPEGASLASIPRAAKEGAVEGGEVLFAANYDVFLEYGVLEAHVIALEQQQQHGGRGKLGARGAVKDRSDVSRLFPLPRSGTYGVGYSNSSCGSSASTAVGWDPVTSAYINRNRVHSHLPPTGVPMHIRNKPRHMQYTDGSSSSSGKIICMSDVRSKALHRSFEWDDGEGEDENEEDQNQGQRQDQEHEQDHNESTRGRLGGSGFARKLAVGGLYENTEVEVDLDEDADNACASMRQKKEEQIRATPLLLSRGVEGEGEEEEERSAVPLTAVSTAPYAQLQQLCPSDGRPTLPGFVLGMGNGSMHANVSKISADVSSTEVPAGFVMGHVFQSEHAFPPPPPQEKISKERRLSRFSSVAEEEKEEEEEEEEVKSTKPSFAIENINSFLAEMARQAELQVQVQVQEAKQEKEIPKVRKSRFSGTNDNDTNPALVSVSTSASALKSIAAAALPASLSKLAVPLSDAFEVATSTVIAEKGETETGKTQQSYSSSSSTISCNVDVDVDTDLRHVRQCTGKVMTTQERAADNARRRDFAKKTDIADVSLSPTTQSHTNACTKANMPVLVPMHVTRKTSVWLPSPILSRRMGVRAPTAASMIEGVPLSVSPSSYLPPAAKEQQLSNEQVSAVSASASICVEEGLQSKAQTQARIASSLYRSIFTDDAPVSTSTSSTPAQAQIQLKSISTAATLAHGSENDNDNVVQATQAKVKSSYDGKTMAISTYASQIGDADEKAADSSAPQIVFRSKTSRTHQQPAIGRFSTSTTQAPVYPRPQTSFNSGMGMDTGMDTGMNMVHGFEESESDEDSHSSSSEQESVALSVSTDAVKEKKKRRDKKHRKEKEKEKERKNKKKRKKEKKEKKEKSYRKG